MDGPDDERGALLVFSDGKVLNPLEVFQACRNLKAAHGGEFCIFTVFIGDDPDGRKMMEDLASANDCGRFYDATFLNTAISMDAMARIPATRIRLDGHTDFHVSNSYNQQLSERRVNAVKAALARCGVDSYRMNTNAYGEERPTVPNDSAEHLHMNRRVELSVAE